MFRTAAAIIAALVLCTPPGQAEVLLIEHAGGPWWAPDGTSLLCHRLVPPHDDEDTQIWTIPLAGGDPDTLITDPSGAFFPIWIPDGLRVAYHRMRATEQQTRHEFVIHNTSDSTQVVWEAENSWDDPGFNLTPDGTEILYTRMFGPVLETWALDIAAGTTRFVVTGSGGVISPDGHWIAFFNSSDMLTVAPMGGDPVQIPEMGCCARWTPDSNFLVFTGVSDTQQIDLIAVRRDGSYRQQLTNDAEQDWYCAISPDGTKIAYSKQAAEFAPVSLWMMDLDLGPITVQEISLGGVKALFR